MKLTKTFRFEASHVLPKHPGKCSRLHGHSWVLHVSVEGPINKETGFVQDFAEISTIVKPLIERLDHHHLGTYGFFTDDRQYMEKWGVPGLAGVYPTSENLLVWIALQLRGLDLYMILGGKDPRPIYGYPGKLIEHKSYERVERISGWSRLSLEETCTSRATLTRAEYNGNEQG